MVKDWRDTVMSDEEVDRIVFGDHGKYNPRDIAIAQAERAFKAGEMKSLDLLLGYVQAEKGIDVS